VNVRRQAGRFRGIQRRHIGVLSGPWRRHRTPRRPRGVVARFCESPRGLGFEPAPPSVQHGKHLRLVLSSGMPGDKPGGKTVDHRRSLAPAACGSPCTLTLSPDSQPANPPQFGRRDQNKRDEPLALIAAMTRIEPDGSRRAFIEQFPEGFDLFT
jgi:hypothetical protein